MIYSVPLLLLTGAYVLFMDVKGYEMASLAKEARAARWVGWINLAMGAAIFIARWALQKWGW
ncbi:hypothetical protein SK3146_05999 [Paenibacillus konkukensis]|uniref:Uncharacterized protein n=2 Tax=Paenibacillus TaxID=44249 RepID=A0ABY4RWC0_9BACL|nr:CLC_0170 family protein [Paenibacillus konkukensis]UQZ86706.1 hypothetical protein SK3146_05999 [Paenibacillus konkukensis]